MVLPSIFNLLEDFVKKASIVRYLPKYSSIDVEHEVKVLLEVKYDIVYLGSWLHVFELNMQDLSWLHYACLRSHLNLIVACSCK